MKKKVMKKADGGGVIPNFPGRGAGLRTAMEKANANARFNRPATGGPMAPAKPAMPEMPRAMPVPPMRRAKGGMASGGKWIQEAIKKPGALRATLGAKKGEPIPAGKLAKATHSKNPTTAKRANLAMTLRGMKKK